MRSTLAVVLALAAFSGVVAPAMAHDVAGHADPDLLNHWRAQVHLLIQWTHLVAFALWVGGMLAAIRLPSLRLEPLLFGSWGLFLVSLASGTYNMQFSAATPDAPDVISLPGLAGRWPFGDAYIVLVGAKQLLLFLAAAWTGLFTLLHLCRPEDPLRARLRTAFVGGAAIVGVVIAAVTASVLVLHEAVDLAPTPLHSLGGVVAPAGTEQLAGARVSTDRAPAPYGTDLHAWSAGFRLLAVPRVAADVAARFGHLLGFALWLGGNAAGLLVPRSEMRRLVPLLWLALVIQMVTGTYQMLSWTPFSVVPYPWRVSLMRQFKFGYTYALVLALKLALAGLALLATIGLTVVVQRDETVPGPWVRALQLLALAVGLALAYITVTLLLVHEGVDHAL